LYFAKSRKWQWIILVITIISSILFSTIPIPNLDEYHQYQQNKSLANNYDLEIPVAENINHLRGGSLVKYGLLAYSKNQDTIAPKLIFENINNNEPISIEEIPKVIDFYKNQIDGFERFQLRIVLAVHKNVEMKYLYPVWQQLRIADNKRIGYYVQGENGSYSRGMALMTHLPFPCLPINNDTNFQDYQQQLDTITSLELSMGCYLLELVANNTDDNPIVIELISNQLLINHKKYDLDKIEDTLYQLIIDKTSSIELRIDNESHFGHYLNILDNIKSLQEKKEIAIAIAVFGKSFNDLNYKEQKSIRSKSYLHYTHLTPEEWKYIDYLRAKN
jgi:biopolymer transport protein ExbD